MIFFCLNDQKYAKINLIKTYFYWGVMMRTSVDNRGKGDCMYNAYVISLMYYLRAQDNQTIDDVLALFHLNLDNLARQLQKEEVSRFLKR